MGTRDDNSVLIKKVSSENFTGKILTANLPTSLGKCVIPNEVRDLPGVQQEIVIIPGVQNCMGTRDGTVGLWSEGNPPHLF
jgi:hypothetical protein